MLKPEFNYDFKKISYVTLRKQPCTIFKSLRFILAEYHWTCVVTGRKGTIRFLGYPVTYQKWLYWNGKEKPSSILKNDCAAEWSNNVLTN